MTILTSLNAAHPAHIDLVTAPPAGRIAGYDHQQNLLSLELTWPAGSGPEPSSVLYDSGLRVGDVVLLNNFLYQDACYVPLPAPYQNLVPMLGVRHAAPYYVGSAANERPEIDTSLAHLSPRATQWSAAVGRAMVWWLEGNKSAFYESRINAMRTAFEILCHIDRPQVDAALSDIHGKLQAADAALPATPSVAQCMVVGRHIRNAATHNGRLEPGDANSHGQTYKEAIKRECAQPHRDWQDGCPALRNRVEAAFQADWYGAAFDAVEFVQLVIYAMLLRLLGVPLQSVEFVNPPDPEDKPKDWQDAAAYVKTLRFS